MEVSSKIQPFVAATETATLHVALEPSTSTWPVALHSPAVPKSDRSGDGRRSELPR